MGRLALGTVQFGMQYGVANRSGQVSENQAKSMLGLALKNKIDMLDTAITYGDSESCLGKVGTKGFSLVTKLPQIPNSCHNLKEWVYQQVNTSLSRMGVKKIYGLLLHRSVDLTGSYKGQLFRSLCDLKNDGIVEKIGLSIYSPVELDTLVPHYDFDLIQAPLNLVDRRILTTSWLSRLKDEGIEVHTRSTFLQGLLLLDQAEIPKKFMTWSALWREWDFWLKIHDISALEACLAFTLQCQDVDRVLVGADGLGHLVEILNASKSSLTSFPNISCDDERLINPAGWINL